MTTLRDVVVSFSQNVSIMFKAMDRHAKVAVLWKVVLRRRKVPQFGHMFHIMCKDLLSYHVLEKTALVSMSWAANKNFDCLEDE